MPQEESEIETNEKKMSPSSNLSCYLLFVLPLMFSISCLVASGFVTVERSHPLNAHEMVYSDFPQKEFPPVPDGLPCADIDEYDNLVAPLASNDNTPRQYEPKFDKPQKVEHQEGVENDDPEESEDLDSADPGSDSEDYVKEEKPLTSGGKNDEENDVDSTGVNKPKPTKVQAPAELHTSNIHHKVKFKKLETSAADIEKLERMIERIAEGEEQTLHDLNDEPESTETQKCNNKKLTPRSKPHDSIERDSSYKDSVHRKHIKTRHNDKPKPLTTADDHDETSHSHHLAHKKQARVLRKRHLSARHLSASHRATPSKRDAAIDVDDWGYCGDTGPDKWQEKWPDCGGNAQSPINLDTSQAKIEYEPVLKWKGYSNTPSKMTLINNGHSVVLTTSFEDCGNKPFIWDSIMNHEYVFGELTFHWGADESSGSEHTINFMKYPLEMQVVHYRRELGSIEKAQEVPGGVAVVGILYHLDTDKRHNQGIADIQTGFSKLRDGPSSTTIQSFPLSRLIQQFSKHYLSYNGSMTTPPCTETVIWLIHLKQASISKKQLAKFHRLKNEGVEIKQNNRPVQKTNKRCVLQIT